jgi:isopentenyl-diphosphate Delta-isomerase
MSKEIISRKDEHLDLCLQKPLVPRGVATGLGGYTLEYDALPEIDLQDVSTEKTILGKALAAPLIIGAMTGGSERAKEINRRLANAAAKVGVGLALGSQRAMVADPGLTSSFAVREQVDGVPLLIGNIGAVQLNLGVDSGMIAEAMHAVKADAINFHLNPLQEAIQPEGDTCFAGLWAKMGQTIETLELPCLVKEVGAGLSAKALQKLRRLPLAGVEVAGVGGTSWAKVESYRAPERSSQAVVGERLAGLGVPTAQSLPLCREAMGDRLVIASGGIRNGMDIAVALALGADAVALAQPLLVAAEEGEESLIHALETLVYELRVISFCVGAKDIEELREATVFRADGPWPSFAQ